MQKRCDACSWQAFGKWLLCHLLSCVLRDQGLLTLPRGSKPGLESTLFCTSFHLLSSCVTLLKLYVLSEPFLHLRKGGNSSTDPNKVYA